MVTTVPSTLKAFLLPFARHYRQKGWRVDAAACELRSREDVAREFDVAHDIPLDRSLLRPWRLLRAMTELERICEVNGYELVHVHTPVAAFVTRLALRRLRKRGAVKVVYTAHGFHFFEGAGWLSWIFYGFAERLAGRWTDRLVVINEEDFKRSRRWRIVPDRHLVAMPGIGVDLDFYSHSAVGDAGRKSLRQRIGVDHEHFMILMVAEFSNRKRQSDFLKALAKRGSDATVGVFVGTGPALQRMEELAENLGVQDRVRFLGFRTDVPELMSATDMLLLPSSQEGLPRCVLEAMASGVPIAASDVRGSRDLLANERGWLFPLGDLDAINATIDAVRSNAPEARSRARKAKKAVQDDYELGKIVAAHDQLYGELVGAFRPALGA